MAFRAESSRQSWNRFRLLKLARDRYSISYVLPSRAIVYFWEHQISVSTELKARTKVRLLETIVDSAHDWLSVVCAGSFELLWFVDTHERNVCRCHAIFSGLGFIEWCLRTQIKVVWPNSDTLLRLLRGLVSSGFLKSSPTYFDCDFFVLDFVLGFYLMLLCLILVSILFMFVEEFTCIIGAFPRRYTSCVTARADVLRFSGRRGVYWSRSMFETDLLITIEIDWLLALAVQKCRHGRLFPPFWDYRWMTIDRYFFVLSHHTRSVSNYFVLACSDYLRFLSNCRVGYVVRTTARNVVVWEGWLAYDEWLITQGSTRHLQIVVAQGAAWHLIIV